MVTCEILFLLFSGDFRKGMNMVAESSGERHEILRPILRHNGTDRHVVPLYSDDEPGGGWICLFCCNCSDLDGDTTVVVLIELLVSA